MGGKIKLLDCTLRDGGRIINCDFPNSEIVGLSNGLAEANVDIIEMGFLRDWRNTSYMGKGTFFTSIKQILPFIDRNAHPDTMYAAFIDYGMFDFDSLDECDGASIDIIRFGFTKKDYINNRDDLVRCMRNVKKKGYSLFIQGVNALNYTDKETLELCELVNDIHPKGYGIVDTYGSMYSDDVTHIFSLLHYNLLDDIWLDFHSHNNYQLSFALAQTFIGLAMGGGRSIVIDGTLNGMGKAAGNLCTELIMDYLVRKMSFGYDVDKILDLIDEYIYPYSQNNRWGYSTSAMMAGIYRAHPNNIIYLTEKFRLSSKDIGNMLSMIPPDKRQRYDYDEIERLYMEYTALNVDDSEAVEQLRNEMEGRNILVLAPGHTLITHKELIQQYACSNEVIIISVNFMADDYPTAYHFFGNQRRYDLLCHDCHKGEIIVTSNMKPINQGNIMLNYFSLISRGYKYFENTVIMLLNLLLKLKVSEITLAGFDGFSVDEPNNYVDDGFFNKRHEGNFDIMNKEVRSMYRDVRQRAKGICKMQIITPSVYET